MCVKKYVSGLFLWDLYKWLFISSVIFIAILIASPYLKY